MGCKSGTLPSFYLGMLLGAPFKSKSVWNPVIERIEGILDSWKASLLSKGARLILIKAILSSIPNYFLSLFTVLVSVANRIERLMRTFLWNDSPEHHHYHLVDWNVVCMPIQNSGLDIMRVR